MPDTTPTNGNGHHVPRAPIAIIGLGCVLPDAPDVPRFWQNLIDGRSSIREVPKDRWDPALFHSADRADLDRTYSKLGAFVTDFALDTRRFRIPPNVVKAMDAAQLWALSAAQQALADAGYDAKPFDRSRCGVVLGATGSEEVRTPTALRVYFPWIRDKILKAPSVAAMAPADRDRLIAEFEERFKDGLPRVTEDTMPGELSNIIAGRVANLLDLSGPNFTTDAACASGAAAIDAAVKALQARDVDLVLTGGIDHNQGPTMYVKFSRIGALSGTGSFPFDERADGFIMGEGAVVLLLKRLEDAERDGDRVHAIIRGVGSSSDGKGKGITAPNVEGQVTALRRAYVESGIGPEGIDYVEAHGTGTVVGDAAEIEALRRVYGPGPRATGPVPLGSVKSNIGHLKAASAAAGVLKAVLALRERTLPPSLGYRTPSPHLRLHESPFHVHTTTAPWPAPPMGRPRRAAVSSFGFGGTNFHLVLEEAVAADARLWPLLLA